METIPVISLRAAAFWIALAAALIANGINGVRRERLRQVQAAALVALIALSPLLIAASV